MTDTPLQSAIVTGASGGLGRTVATRLARDGFAVVVNYAGNAAKAAELVNAITSAGGHAIAVQADVANAAAVERLLTRSRAASSRLVEGVCEQRC
jgi:3-oxoacyl-[acyl-carrier protein] reductase